ncbi:MAG: hypothetical protein JWN62_2424 [Acidimicrobiales bacterium]|nr:hypothetical protein [Acidimicrobiales bacterium]
MPASSTTIDIESDVFALRLANLLRATRTTSGRSYRGLARASEGRFTREQLRELEEGTAAVDEEIVELVSALYGADLGTILPNRLPVSITNGVISAGGVRASFVATNATSLLTAYLRLIRSMRRQKKAPMIALRREDVEALAEYLEEPGESIVDRLTALMGATLTQRTAMATMFATGAIVIGLAGSTAARAPDPTGAPVAGGNRTVELVVDDTSTTIEQTVSTEPTADASSSTTVVDPSGQDSPAADPHVVVQDTETTVAASGTAPGTTRATDASGTETNQPATNGRSATTPSSADPTAPDPATPTTTPTTVAPVAGVATDTAPVADAGVPPTTDDLTWLDGDGTTQIPTSANVPADGSPVTTVPATMPATGPVADADPVVPTGPAGEVATDAPPIPSAVPQGRAAPADAATAEGFASAAFVASEAPVAATSSTHPTMIDGASKSSAREARRARRADRKNAAALHRIESRAKSAIERGVNRIYLEADEERVAALQVIYARADTALERASMRIFANGRTEKSEAVLAGVKEEILARAEDDKDIVLDSIYTRAHAERTALTTAVELQARAAREGLGLV